MDYSKTLNLPKTGFPMRAGLAEKEPKILSNWQAVYERLCEKTKNNPAYILHDGPPYANGKIHIGHTLNKILKDTVVKYKFLRGYYSRYVPGWDCHGLPVELKLLEELGVRKDEVDQNQFRQKAKDFAAKFVDIQRKDFVRLGVWGDWDKPYLTFNPDYEAGVLEVLAGLVQSGYIYRGLKPVNWCVNCATALAEAEVEYKDKVSDSIYVRFKLKDNLGQDLNHDIDVVVWTTTPWTLISNTAVAVHPDMDYIIADTDKGILLFAEKLTDSLKDKFLGEDIKVIKKVKGKSLESKVTRHPFLNRESKVIWADFVSSEEGSGCVHIAPGHGQEDFLVGKKYNLPVIMPVDNKGVFRNAGEYSNLHVYKINNALIEAMEKKGTLLKHEKITHSYPHCWRCKKPLIFRTTKQWFLDAEHKDLRKRLLSAVGAAEWIPKQGKSRISAMVETRPDWCLSRQRLWGIPIPAVKCKKCGEEVLDVRVIRNFLEKVKGESSNVWFYKDIKEFLPSELKCRCSAQDFEKSTDILDVWFESGASFLPVVKNNPLLKFPADLYLEGSDQHRGWFQVSLILAVALEDKAPFKNVLTHGFVVDGEGKKMSKSQGNVIAPQKIMNKYGAEILRLWVNSGDYSEDVSLSDDIVKQLVDAYRKVRNTFRFLLANTKDFDCNSELIGKDELLEVDRYMLSVTANLQSDIEELYDKFLFYRVYHKIYEFCNVALSSFYLDILKDRLYTFPPQSQARKSAQVVLWYILNLLLKILAPVLSFTCEEAYSYFDEPDKQDSVFLSKWPEYRLFIDKGLEKKWERILEVREDVLKKLEERRAESQIRSSLEAGVCVKVRDEHDYKVLSNIEDTLREVFIVSAVQVEKAEAFSVEVTKARGEKCPRCWNYAGDIGGSDEYPEVCGRCVKSLKQINNV